jgi:hypothetical protein
MSHALIIGGTGMLAPVTEHLCKNYNCVSLICRNVKRINSNLKNVNPIILDYTHYKGLSAGLYSAIERFGNIELVVSWIHSNAPFAPFIVAQKLNSCNTAFQFFDILGSAYAHPAGNSGEREGKFKKNKNLQYRKIILGFKIENKVSRWLTHNEISSGIIKAIKTGRFETVIGTVMPWDSRP